MDGNPESMVQVFWSIFHPNTPFRPLEHVSSFQYFLSSLSPPFMKEVFASSLSLSFSSHATRRLLRYATSNPSGRDACKEKRNFQSGHRKKEGERDVKVYDVELFSNQKEEAGDKTLLRHSLKHLLPWCSLSPSSVNVFRTSSNSNIRHLICAPDTLMLLQIEKSAASCVHLCWGPAAVAVILLLWLSIWFAGSSKSECFRIVNQP